jgi:hypothetical protein
MYLNKEEEKILRGEYGEGMQRAMELLVAIGDANDARRMIPISRAHAASSGQEADLYYIELLVRGGASCSMPTGTDPIYDIDYFNKIFEIPENEAEIPQRVIECYERIGAMLNWCCIPYISENIPLYGEHVAFSESSATPYVNSVIGARTNREAAQSALAAGVIGKTPEYGLHLPENRKGNFLVKVEATLKDDFDYSLLGYYVGKRVGYGIPVLTGLQKCPTMEEFISFCAMSNTSGAVPMFHIPGITPEARTIEEAFQGDVPEDVITVTDQELQQVNEELQTTSGEIDLVMLGCPHYTLNQVAKVAILLKGKKIHRNIAFWICTSATTRLLAKRAGYVDIIEKAGGHVVADTCIDQPCWREYRNKVGITDSPKCAYYRRFKEAMVRRLSDCVEAAIKGRWE